MTKESSVKTHMELHNGMVCPACKRGTISSKARVLKFEYKQVQSAFFTPKLYRCTLCDKEFLDDDDQQRLDDFLTDERRLIDRYRR